MSNENIDDDQLAISHLLQAWWAYTPSIKLLILSSLDFDSFKTGETVQISGSPQMTVTRTGNEFDVRGEQNRGYTVFEIDGREQILNPTLTQLRSFMVKSLNWGALDKGIYRPFMQNRIRFDEAAIKVHGIRTG